MTKIAAKAVLAACLLALAACAGDTAGGDRETLTIYSGREEDLVSDLFERFEQRAGVNVEVRYGDSAELASQILEEGGNSRADVFFSQDAGALGALAEEDLLVELEQDLLQRVPARFRADDGTWVGISGRVRTLVYNTERVQENELPDSVLDLTGRRWRNKLGWAPTNASFQAFVTALRLERGDDTARSWLRSMKDNGTQSYAKNSAIVEAVASGEIDAGLVNHYYLMRMLAEDPSLTAKNHFFEGGDPGALVNVAGVGIVRATDEGEVARRFVEFLLEDEQQRFFVEQTFEYPLVEGIQPAEGLPRLGTLEPPSLDLSRLADLQATLQMLSQTGVLGS